MIVDVADMEMEMATDPFIEAGIEVPANLPYQQKDQKEDSFKKVVGEENDDVSIADKIRKMSSWRNSSAAGSDVVGSAMFSRKNSVYGSKRSIRSQTSIAKRKRTIR